MDLDTAGWDWSSPHSVAPRQTADILDCQQYSKLAASPQMRQAILICHLRSSVLQHTHIGVRIFVGGIEKVIKVLALAKTAYEHYHLTRS